MAKTFKFSIGRKNPDDILKHFKEKMLEFGGYFSESNRKGDFKIKGISGKYQLCDKNLILNITNKPIILSWNLIERKLKEYFR